MPARGVPGAATPHVECSSLQKANGAAEKNQTQSERLIVRKRKTAPDWTPLIRAQVLMMEARGFEPRSEKRSTTASTCVFH